MQIILFSNLHDKAQISIPYLLESPSETIYGSYNPLECQEEMHGQKRSHNEYGRPDPEVLEKNPIGRSRSDFHRKAFIIQLLYLGYKSGDNEK